MESGLLKFVFRWDVDVNTPAFHLTRFDESLDGPLFLTTHNHISFSWQPAVFPQGCQLQDGSEEHDHISCYLFYMDGLWDKIKPVLIEVNVLKTDSTSQELFKERIRPPVSTLSNLQKGNGCGNPKLITNEIGVLKDTNYLLSGKLLRILIQLLISPEYFDPVHAINQLQSDICPADYPKHSGELYRSRFPQVTGEIGFDELDGTKFVVTAEVFPETKKSFNCHLHFLNLHIPDYMQALMTSDTIEANENAVTWPHHPDVVLETFRFMYTGEVSNNFGSLASDIIELAEYLMYWPLKWKCAEKMLEVLNKSVVEEFAEKAHKLNLPKLKQACEKLMVEIIQAKNALTYLLLAEKYNFPVLRHVAINVIVENYKEIQNHTTARVKNEGKQVDESEGESEEAGCSKAEKTYKSIQKDLQPFGGIIGNDLVKEILDVMSTRRLDPID